tara:strand:+ start:786 stop:1292 length:507 start_codon:yes stop_codon:yes gene_type:complete
MKNLLLKLKILEIKLKTSGPIGYFIYCVIGIAVMIAVWGPIFTFVGWILTPFTTPILDIKDFGSLSIFGIIGYTFLIIIIFVALSGSITAIGEIVKSIYKKEKINFKLNEFLTGVGCIVLAIFLYKYFDNGFFRNIAIGLFLIAGIGGVGMSLENDTKKIKKRKKRRK